MTSAIVGLVLGTTLAFGGAVWWGRPIIAILTLLVVLTCLIRMLLQGTLRVLKSPLTLLGALALGLGGLQLTPLPAPLAARLSPTAHAAYGRGFLPALARADDPGHELPEAAAIVRSSV